MLVYWLVISWADLIFLLSHQAQVTEPDLPRDGSTLEVQVWKYLNLSWILSAEY